MVIIGLPAFFRAADSQKRAYEYNPLMRHPYYIKMVYGSTTPDSRPWKEGEESNLHFAEDQKKLCSRFVQATGVLVYETRNSGGDRTGSQRIFARATINTLNYEDVWDKEPIVDSTGKKYPLGVKVLFDKIVPSEKGLPLEEIYDLCPRLTNHFKQAQGGLIGITLDEFVALKDALGKR